MKGMLLFNKLSVICQICQFQPSGKSLFVNTALRKLYSEKGRSEIKWKEDSTLIEANPNEEYVPF